MNSICWFCCSFFGGENILMDLDLLGGAIYNKTWHQIQFVVRSLDHLLRCRAENPTADFQEMNFILFH